MWFNRIFLFSGALLLGGCMELPQRNSHVDAALPLPAPVAMPRLQPVVRPPLPAVAVTSAPVRMVMPVVAQPAKIPPSPRVAAGDSGFRQNLALQIFLDRHNFSGGCIDGIVGFRTRQAIRGWQAHQGLLVTGVADAALRESAGPLDSGLTTYVVAEADHADLVEIPGSWQGKSELPYLGYETILEYVAEKYHASQAAIRRLNPDALWPNPPAGTLLAVPNPFPPDRNVADHVRISLGEKSIRVMDAQGKPVAVFPCSIAQREEKRLTGDFAVANVAVNPDYTFDPAVFVEVPEARAMQGKRIIAPGPNNPVGVAWISLNRPGFGMHGTPHPEDIGKTESHGCFRLSNWNARKLAGMVAIGMPVKIEP